MNCMKIINKGSHSNLLIGTIFLATLVFSGNLALAENLKGVPGYEIGRAHV